MKFVETELLSWWMNVLVQFTLYLKPWVINGIPSRINLYLAVSLCFQKHPFRRYFHCSMRDSKWLAFIAVVFKRSRIYLGSWCSHCSFIPRLFAKNYWGILPLYFTFIFLQCDLCSSYPSKGQSFCLPDMDLKCQNITCIRLLTCRSSELL